jgi:ABC-type Mn2+/Zn2+ transport system ATPase subunit
LSDPRTNAAPEAHIVVEDLTMADGDFVIQHDLNFTINKGDIFIIMGGSKSTLALSGSWRPPADGCCTRAKASGMQKKSGATRSSERPA